MIVQFTGLSGSGKSTLARKLYESLQNIGIRTELLDGDEYRELISSGLGFSKEDRITNIKRLGFIAGKLSTHGVVAVIAAIAPYEESRSVVEEYAVDNYCLIHTHCPIKILRLRDPKSLYRRAFLSPSDPEYLPNFTGVSDPYEKPSNADIVVCTNELTESQSSSVVLNTVLDKIGKSIKKYLD